MQSPPQISFATELLLVDVVMSAFNIADSAVKVSTFKRIQNKTLTITYLTLLLGLLLVSTLTVGEQ